MESESRHWFCGGNWTTKKEEGFLDSTCKVNGAIVLAQTIFALIFIAIPVILQCCTSYGKRPGSRFIFRLPGHSLRWVLSFVFVVFSLSLLGEGVLTNDSWVRSGEGPMEPHLFLPGALLLIGAVMSLVYYHVMETWQAMRMAWLLLAYWVVTIATFVAKLIHLDLIGLGDWDVFNYDVTLGVTLLVGVLLLIEITLLYSMVCRGCGDPFHAPPPGDAQIGDMRYMHEFSTLLSTLTYWWMNWLFILGFKKPIEPSDLGTIPEAHTAEFNHYRFKENFVKEKENAKSQGRDINMYRVYWDTYGFRMLFGGLCKLCADFANYVGPLCISGIILYATAGAIGPSDGEDDDNTTTGPPHYVTVTEFFENGFVLVGCIFIASVLKGFFDQTYQYICYMEGLHAKSAVQSMAYEKSLRLSTYAMSGGMMTMGQITNHMSVDATNIQLCFNYANEIWTTPIKIGITLYLLYLELGTPSLIGASIFIIVVPLQLILAGLTSKFIKAVLINSDERLKISNEMLQGIKILKLYGWERIHCDTVKAARQKEMNQLANVYLIQATFYLVNLGVPIIVNLVSFGTYTAITGNVLTPDIAFSSLYLFNSLVDPMFIFPYVISLCVNSHVSSLRIRNFLIAPEIEGRENDRADKQQDLTRSSSMSSAESAKSSPSKLVLPVDIDLDTTKPPLLGSGQSEKKSYGALEKSAQPPVEGGLSEDIAIRIKDGNFTWDPASDRPVLKDINVDIPEGKLTIIVGSVGSGKSSILQAILGEMTTLQGRIQIRKGARIAYAPQKAWLVNASLKENIVFGGTYDPAKYRKVVDACALAPDIEMLPGGDDTEIGEKGLNLSGGQKQRVSVARTIYSYRDIVVLDDPLSALDMHVGYHLFENGIVKILKKLKHTVILVTHQLQYLPDADKIIVMQDGKIRHQGDPDEIAQADPRVVADWQQAIKQMSESEAELSGGESEGVLEERRQLKKQISRMSSVSHVEAEDEDTRGQLVVKEDQEKGSVSYQIYMYYLKAVKYWVAALVMLAILGGSAFEIATNFWLAEWTEASLEPNDTKELIDESSYYISIYAVLSASNLACRLIFIVVVCIGVYFAAKKMHLQMLDNIISVPMRFFDTTPTGRILNRLSSDTQLIDQRLIQSIRLLLNLGLLVISAFVVIIAVEVFFIFFIIPVAVIFCILLVYYVMTSRELQRCESVTRSPIFAHFSETLGGLPTLRAFQDEKRFFQTSLNRILINNKVFAYLITAQRWIGIRLDLLGAVVVLFSSLLCLLGTFYFGIDASQVGLAISYALEISLFMNLTVRAAAEVELQMNAVERVKYYAELPVEDYEGIEPPPSWPDKGLIELRDISVRYAEGLDAVLSDINISIPPQDKLGICGRTGSGKSSLTLALFRIIDTFKGSIIIDGIDIASVPLLALRQRLSIIPQDAFLFTGTIRTNLDPTNIKQDGELWQALEIAQLKDVVSELGGGLDYDVTEGGENFSAGQRQLFCLARAFLRNSKIVIMDEATASIDRETDGILQEVVAEVFQDRTVLTIAHRVATILNSDNILTLQDGKVLEYDSPTKLLDDETSMFTSLVNAGK